MAKLYDEFEFDNWEAPSYSLADPSPIQELVEHGDGNSLPTITQSTQSTDWMSWFRQVGRDIGQASQVARTAARDVGSVVGTIRNESNSATTAYRTAERNARTGNTLGQWWQYSGTGEKVVVILALAGVGFAAYQAYKT